MFRLSMLGLAVLLSSSVVTKSRAEDLIVDASESAMGRTIIMFGASWCAPCVAEMRNIAKLAAAADPDRIVIVWADSGIRRYSMPRQANVEIASESEVRRFRAVAAPENAGLPYTAMLDHRGQKCAEWRGMLRPEDIVRIRATCRD